MSPAALLFEWDALARILGLAAAAGLHLPLLLVLPWLLGRLPWVGGPGTGLSGGLDSPALAALGVVLLAGWLLVRRLPPAGAVVAVLLAGAGVVTAALLPWLLSAATEGGSRILESLAAVIVSGSVAGVRLGWHFIHAHPPATLPGSELVRRHSWILPGLAGTLVVGTATAPGAGGLLALGLLCLALGPGRGALRASAFALGVLARLLGRSRHDELPAWALEGDDTGSAEAPPPAAAAESGGEGPAAGELSVAQGSRRAPRGVPAALLGYGGGGLRPGWLIAGLGGDADHLCFRYRTPLGAWDLELSGADAEEFGPGPLVRVRTITRGAARHVLLLPPGPTPGASGRTNTAQRNL
ncbi:MAG: hypothetical protein EA350_12540 [Gemmatimonadales bacterium]|nr:MAG: hypothetical protein EA350_12540 [Gemmatimonadales bacterium]